MGGLARFIRRRSRAAAQSVPISQPLALSVLTSQPGRFSGRIGRLESLPRYAPILILEQAITGTVPGSACGKAEKFREKLDIFTRSYLERIVSRDFGSFLSLPSSGSLLVARNGN